MADWVEIELLITQVESGNLSLWRQQEEDGVTAEFISDQTLNEETNTLAPADPSETPGGAWASTAPSCLFVNFSLLASPSLFFFLKKNLFHKFFPCNYHRLIPVDTGSLSLLRFLIIFPSPSGFALPLARSFFPSWFCAHAPSVKSGGESHGGKFPANRFLCSRLVSQHRCQG